MNIWDYFVVILKVKYWLSIILRIIRRRYIPSFRIVLGLRRKLGICPKKLLKNFLCWKYGLNCQRIYWGIRGKNFTRPFTSWWRPSSYSRGKWRQLIFMRVSRSSEPGLSTSNDHTNIIFNRDLMDESDDIVEDLAFLGKD